MLAAGVLVASPASAGDGSAGWRWEVTSQTRFQYVEDEDLFGGEYAPIWERFEYSAERGHGLRLVSSFDLTRDLAASDRLQSSLRAAYLELESVKVLALARARLGRVLLRNRGRVALADGGELVFRLRKGLDLELHAGRQTVFPDSRYPEPLLEPAPWTDGGAVLGSALAWRPGRRSALSLGWAAFDPGGELSREDALTYQAGVELKRVVSGLRFDLQGFATLTDGAGSETRARLAWSPSRRSSLAARYERVVPDRLNPDVVTSILVADAIDTLAAGATLPLLQSVLLSAEVQGVWFGLPGGTDPDQSTFGVLFRLERDPRLARGPRLGLRLRYLSGEAGDHRELGALAEWLLLGQLSLGGRFSWVDSELGEGDGETAWLLAARVVYDLGPGISIAAELLDLSNPEYDHNLRARFELVLRGRHVDDF